MKKWNNRPMRRVLIVATVCLALVGTAFAATAIYQLTLRAFSDERNGDRYSGYMLYGEPATYSLEEFSRELQDDFTAWDPSGILFRQEFDTWEEVKAYLGDDIPCVWHQMDINDITWDSGYSVYVSYSDGKAQCVSVSRVVQRGSRVSYSTDAVIYTPDYPHEELGRIGWLENQGDIRVLGSYTMANGCVAEILLQTVSQREGKMDQCFGIFMREGILYTVELHGTISSPLSKTQLKSQIHKILDSFA